MDDSPATSYNHQLKIEKFGGFRYRLPAPYEKPF